MGCLCNDDWVPFVKIKSPLVMLFADIRFQTHVVYVDRSNIL